MNHTTLSVLFGIAYAASPTSPGAPCDLAAFSGNVRSSFFNIYNVYFVVTKSPIYSFSHVFQHFLRPVSLLICSKLVYFILSRRRAADWRPPAFIKTCRRSSHKWTTHGKILSHWLNATLSSAQCAGSCTRSVWMGCVFFNLLVQES